MLVVLKQRNLHFGTNMAAILFFINSLERDWLQEYQDLYESQ
jgi:hypothetical protein